MTTRRTTTKADQFAEALEHPETVPNDPTMAALLALAAGLATIPQQRAPFRDALRTRLVSEAAQVLPGTPTAPAPAPAVAAAPSGAGLTGALAGPAMQVATGALAAVVAVTGTGVAASRSLPGDPFYSLKRTVERIQLGLAGGTVDEGVKLFDQAEERLDEIAALVGRTAADLSAAAQARIKAALAALDSDVRRAVDRLLRAAGSGDVRAYEELRDLLARLGAELSPLLALLPADLRAQANGVLALIGDATGRLAHIPVPSGVPAAPSSSPTTVPTTPSSPKPTDLPTGVPTTPPPTQVPTTPPPTKQPTPTPSIPLPTVSVPSLPGLGD